MIKETAGTDILHETNGKSEPVYPSKGIMLISQTSRHITSVVETLKRLKRMLFILTKPNVQIFGGNLPFQATKQHLKNR